MGSEAQARIKKVVILLIILVSVWQLFNAFSPTTFNTFDTYAAIGVGIGVLHGLLALRVRHDARKRGNDQAGVWMAAVLIPTIGILGLFAYLAQRDSHSDHQPSPERFFQHRAVTTRALNTGLP